MNDTLHRRRFIEQAALGGVGLVLAGHASAADAPSNKVVLGVMGLSRGQAHAGQEGDDVLREAAAFEEPEQHDRAEQGTAVVAGSAEDEGQPDEERLLGQEHVGLDVGQVVGEEDPRQPGDGGADGEGLTLNRKTDSRRQRPPSRPRGWPEDAPERRAATRWSAQ
jgi:hypothetical protein